MLKRDRKEGRGKKLHRLELKHLSLTAPHVLTPKHKNPCARRRQKHVHVDGTPSQGGKEREKRQKRVNTCHLFTSDGCLFRERLLFSF